MTKRELYVITCETESLDLSSQMELEAWNACHQLMDILEDDSKKGDLLFSWRRETGHVAKAKEVYSWREAIDLIKSSDLTKIVLDKQELPPLAKSKPIMLRLAGEITNSLLHSYNSHHRITFTQRTSKDPP